MLSILNRNLIILFLCQMVFTTSTVLLVTIGGIVGYGLAPNPSWATLPVALMVVGTASMAIPAAMLMQKVGRRLGFVCGAALGAGGALLIVFALGQSSFLLLCIAATCIGGSTSFSQQFRFAGAESVALDKTSYAISFILLGSIVGAIIGPEIIALSANVSANESSQQPYTLAFKVVIGLYLGAMMTLSFFKKSDFLEQESIDEPQRPITSLITHPIFFVAVMAGMVGQGVMTYIMTATPISMNIADGFSIQETSEVIRAHVIAMYLPSLITPYLITQFGLIRVMALGAIAMAVTIAIGLAGHELLHYWFALIILGVGWNFLFIGGTTLLVQAYKPSERFKSQAFNDFGVFTVSAMASLLSGTILYTFGWTFLLSSAIPALVIMGAGLFILSRRNEVR